MVYIRVITLTDYRGDLKLEVRGGLMSAVIRTQIIKIGNSQGVRIPELLLEQANLAEGEEIELVVDQEQIVLRSIAPPRHGWDEAFKAMAEHGDDALLDDGAATTTSWDDEEWEWS